jgi:hypothetical protein
MDEGAKRYCGGWINRQPELFPWLEDAIDPITARLERLIILLDTLSLEAFVVHLRKTMDLRSMSAAGHSQRLNSCRTAELLQNVSPVRLRLLAADRMLGHSAEQSR